MARGIPTQPSWDRDHTVLSAMRPSVLWFFQRIAPRIGAERMHEWLQTAGVRQCRYVGADSRILGEWPAQDFAGGPGAVSAALLRRRVADRRPPRRGGSRRARTATRHPAERAGRAQARGRRGRRGEPQRQDRRIHDRQRTERQLARRPADGCGRALRVCERRVARARRRRRLDGTRQAMRVFKDGRSCNSLLDGGDERGVGREAARAPLGDLRSPTHTDSSPRPPTSSVESSPVSFLMSAATREARGR